jgi:hypothetical protein
VVSKEGVAVGRKGSGGAYPARYTGPAAACATPYESSTPSHRHTRSSHTRSSHTAPPVHGCWALASQGRGSFIGAVAMVVSSRLLLILGAAITNAAPDSFYHAVPDAEQFVETDAPTTAPTAPTSMPSLPPTTPAPTQEPTSTAPTNSPTNVPTLIPTKTPTQPIRLCCGTCGECAQVGVTCDMSWAEGCGLYDPPPLGWSGSQTFAEFCPAFCTEGSYSTSYAIGSYVGTGSDSYSGPASASSYLPPMPIGVADPWRNHIPDVAGTDDAGATASSYSPYSSFTSPTEDDYQSNIPSREQFSNGPRAETQIKLAHNGRLVTTGSTSWSTPRAPANLFLVRVEHQQFSQYSCT